MTNNKFWLVWESNISYQTHKTQESAIKEARKLAKNGDSPYYVLEATHSFKSDVNIIETSFEATPEEPLAVEAKFKIGDRVFLDNYYECVIDDYFDETKSYKLSIMGGGYNIANEIRITKK